MKRLLEAAVNRKDISDEDIVEALRDICEETHSSCDNECPVFERYGYVPVKSDGRMGRTNCLYFKDGLKMLKFLRG